MLLVAGLIGMALGASCSEDGRPEVHQGTGGQSGSAGSAGTGGSDDGGPQDGALADVGDALGSDAPQPPVRVGIIPVPRANDAGPSAGDDTAAQLEVLAAGARGVSVIRRWDQLFVAPSQPNATAWSDLGNIATLYHGAGRGLLLCLSLVDHTLDARPSGVTGSWNSTTTRAALDAAVDKTFATFGDELVALSFGNELDRWLGTASTSERAAMVSLLQHGVDYARGHPARPSAAVIGVTLTWDSLTQGKPVEVPQLAALGDVVVATYYPLDSAFKVRSAGAVSGDLDLLVGALGSDAGEAGAPKPVLLQEVGYPSASECGSSPEQQRTFFVNVFQALSTRRGRFPFLCVNGLYESVPASCSAAAAALGAASNPNAENALCSLGLRQADGSGKPAYDAVLDGLATFASP